ncbi:MAG: CRISPR-associated endonuclease Cas3'', partial [Bryobacteraceae bacterium]
MATLAEAFAKEANPEDRDFHVAARAAGLLHDLGKYTEEFQRKIRGEANKASHSAHGAAIALKAKAMEVAFAIAGHHAGLPDPKGGRACLWERTNDVDAALDGLWSTAVNDCSELSECRSSLVRSSENLTDFDLRTRMLFSCLVDADRIDSSGERQT